MHLRRSVGSVPCLLLAACLAATADAATVTLANFESGLPAGWQATPGGWVVGGTTNTSPNILPAQGALFARCGAPNVASEAAVGTLLSPPLVVRSQQLAWISCGWSGQFGNGLNRFEILNAQQQVFSTRRDLASARYNTITSHLRLKAAAGALKEEDLEEVNRALQ